MAVDACFEGLMVSRAEWKLVFAFVDFVRFDLSAVMASCSVILLATAVLA